MFIRRSLTILGAATIAALTATWMSETVHAQTVLLSDSFNRVTGNANPDNGDTFSDWGDNDNSDGGTITQTYIHTPSRPPEDGGVDQTTQDADGGFLDGDTDEEGVIRFGAIAVDYDLATDANVLSGGGYTVDFNFRRGPVGFVSFTFGTDPNLIGTTLGGAAFLPVNSGLAVDTEHGYVFQLNPDSTDNSGRVQVFEYGSQLDPPGNINNAFGDVGFAYDAQITVSAPDGFDSGDSISVDLSIGGTAIPAASHTVVSDGNFPGYIAFSANSGAALIDDLKITAFEGSGFADEDLNMDGFVDGLDLGILLGNFDQNGVPASGGELNGTDPVDGLDLGILLGAWNPPPSVAGATVPEPSSAVLLLVASLSLMSRRRVA